MAGEDFSFIGQAVPSCFMFLGIRNETAGCAGLQFRGFAALLLSLLGLRRARCCPAHLWTCAPWRPQVGARPAHAAVPAGRVRAAAGRGAACCAGHRVPGATRLAPGGGGQAALRAVRSASCGHSHSPLLGSLLLGPPGGGVPLLVCRPNVPMDRRRVERHFFFACLIAEWRILHKGPQPRQITRGATAQRPLCCSHVTCCPNQPPLPAAWHGAHQHPGQAVARSLGSAL